MIAHRLPGLGPQEEARPTQDRARDRRPDQDRADCRCRLPRARRQDAGRPLQRRRSVAQGPGGVALQAARTSSALLAFSATTASGQDCRSAGNDSSAQS